MLGEVGCLRSVEGFDVLGGMVGKNKMSSSIKVLLEIVSVFDVDGTFVKGLR